MSHIHLHFVKRTANEWKHDCLGVSNDLNLHESDTSKTRLEPVHLFSHFTSRTNFLFYNSEFRGLTKGLENDKGWQTPICLVSELVQVQPLGSEPGLFWRANFAVMRTYPGQPSKVMTVNSVNMALPTLSKLKSRLFHSRFFSCKIRHITRKSRFETQKLCANKTASLYRSML